MSARTTRSSGSGARRLITDSKGNTIFEQKDVEVPVDWSMTATNIVASKYLHGQIGTPERETGVRQLVGRVAETIRDWGLSRRLLCHRRGCGHLPRRAGAHAAHAEGGLQLAGLVQRGLRPAGAGLRRPELALGPGHRRRRALPPPATAIRSARPASSTPSTTRWTPS